MPVDMLVPFNDDLNCQMFATKLATLLSFGEIDCKYKYMIFGLRKGITEPIIYQYRKGYISGINQVKTQADLNRINRVFEKMEEGLRCNHTSFLAQAGQTPVIIIGLPYEMRAEDRFRDFVKLIYKIEKPALLKIMPTPSLLNHKNSTCGDIDLIYAEDSENIEFDYGSQGQRFAQDTIYRLEQEQAISEEEEEEEEDDEENTEDASVTTTFAGHEVRMIPPINLTDNSVGTF